jgi:ribonuclease G
VHQLRLRDIGGIIVIDFIDMANPKNRATVEEALKTELERDRTKTYVVEISPLGLVEMTRQNVTDGPREILTQKCPTCGGDGIVISAHSAAIDAERRLRDLARNAKRGVEAFRVELEQNVASHLIGPGASRLMEIEALAKRRFFLEGKTGVAVDHFKVKAEGKLADIAPKAPVEEGAEIRLELVEVGQHDIAAGVGKLDGLTISVADASKLVGKKAKVRVERVLNGTAYATLVQTAAQSAKMDVPITAESEAEKPTRAPRKKKVEETKPAVERPVRDSEPVEEVPATDETMPAVEAEAEEAATSEEEAPKPKKKTRRGSRGGRNRRKKPAVAAAAAAAAAAENGQSEEAPTPATIHVPSPELGQTTDGANADGEQPPKKKRTRRGSRGGRNRRKKPAAASAEAKTES